MVVIGSDALGLPPGTVAELDDVLRKLAKEDVARRCVSLLNALAADRTESFGRVNKTLIGALPEPDRTMILSALRDDTLFFEPLQQLVLLRRALVVCPSASDVSMQTDDGIRLYVRASRLATDAIPKPEEVSNGNRAGDWLSVAAGLMTRMWITHPVHPTRWIGRSIEMFERLPELRPELSPAADRLKEALASGLGVSFPIATTLIRFLSLWAIRLKVEEVFSNPNAAVFDPKTWMDKLNIPAADIAQFLDRTTLGIDDKLDNELPGGAIGIIPFRDRPLIRFSDGFVAPIYPELLIEKLTPLMFWWSSSPGAKQQHHWRADWGVLAEAYVALVLDRIAKKTDCTFVADIKKDEEWQIDGALWSGDDRVCLFEVSAGGMKDAASAAGDAGLLKEGLRWTFVESTGRGKPKAEGVQQLGRDVRLLAEGVLRDYGVPLPSRVHPVLVTFDRRLQTPGVWFYLDDELTAVLPRDRPWDISPLAVMTIEDLEAIESLAEAGKLGGSPPGILKPLRLWEATHGKREAWWSCFAENWPKPPDNQRLKRTGEKWMESIKQWFEAD